MFYECPSALRRPGGERQADARGFAADELRLRAGPIMDYSSVSSFSDALARPSFLFAGSSVCVCPSFRCSRLLKCSRSKLLIAPEKRLTLSLMWHVGDQRPSTINRYHRHPSGGEHYIEPTLTGVSPPFTEPLHCGNTVAVVVVVVVFALAPAAAAASGSCRLSSSTMCSLSSSSESELASRPLLKSVTAERGEGDTQDRFSTVNHVSTRQFRGAGPPPAARNQRLSDSRGAG